MAEAESAGERAGPAEETTAAAMSVATGEETNADKDPVEKKKEQKEEEVEGEAGDSDSEEDVYEVEQIIDYKTEDGEVLYRVRWKGYSSEDDTWEPASHLEDCREVLLAFQKKIPETKAKPAKKETQKLPTHDDIFEADSDSDWQSDAKEEVFQKKKKKKHKDDVQAELKKKKSKSAKQKEKHKTETESTDDSLVESKSKKRLSEAKEDVNEIKKTKKDESKEHKKTKKVETKDVKVKQKEDTKEQKKAKQEKPAEQPVETELNTQDLPPQAMDSEPMEVQNDASPEEATKTKPAKVYSETAPAIDEQEQPEGMASTDEDDVQVKAKKKKKKEKVKKHEKQKEELKTIDVKEVLVEKKSTHKKQRILEKIRAVTEMNRPPINPALVQKNSRPSTEDKAHKTAESISEESKKIETVKEKPRKKNDVEKEVKKEHKVPKNFKEMKTPIDMFKITAEDRAECTDGYRKKEETLFERSTDDNKARDNKQAFNQRRNIRDETDTWTYIAAEGEQEVTGTMFHTQDNTDAKQQVLSLGMDLQLEWMSLEDFQRHLDGEDEVVKASDAITNAQLRDAVRNGDYTTVKLALNSKEPYDLEQEDSSGMTLVMFAAAGGHDDILRLLVKKGAKINSRQKNGTTALIHAAEKNFLTSAAILLDAGAYVNIQQTNGETALMKACKRGNSDVVRLMIEAGADCNTLSKHQNSALHFAKQSNNVLVYELLKNHLETISKVAEDTIRDYFESRLGLLEAVFPISCYRLCEGPDFALDFSYRPPHVIPEGSGILLFVFHANFFGKDVVARLCGPCSVQAVVLNDKFQLPVFLTLCVDRPSKPRHIYADFLVNHLTHTSEQKLANPVNAFQDSHFIYSFSPVAGTNKLFIRLTDSPTAKVKLLICAYKVQLL